MNRSEPQHGDTEINLTFLTLLYLKEHQMKTKLKFLPVAALCAAFAAFSISAHADGGRFKKSNSAGGVTAGAAQSVEGAKGKYKGARGVTTDAAGNAVGGSAGEVTTATGTAKRSGKFSKSADGSATRSGSSSGSGARGSYSTSASTTRTADGNVSGGRSTQVTSAATGNSADINTTYTKGDGNIGATRTATCKDASGATITCPSR
jgi:hypothetical protein